ncbi:MAG: hypothetical protein ABIO70_10325 [Pseudomonadota bacterium]
MPFTVGGLPATADGTAVALSTRDLLNVEGEAVAAAWMEGFEDQPFTRSGSTWTPPAALQHRLDTAGRLYLVVVDGNRRVRVPVDRSPVKLTDEELRLLLAELRDLSLSFENPSIYADLDTAAPLGRRAARSPEERMAALFEALDRHLPPLLERPLRVLGLETGAVPAARARPSPRTLIQRFLAPERTHILGVAQREQTSEVDYLWLRAVAEAVTAYAARRSRIHQDIRDEPREQESPWLARHGRLSRMLAHEELAHLTSGRPGRPSWILTRSVHGGAIMRAADEAQVDERHIAASEWRGGVENLALFPVADHGHLYELWVFFSLVELLRGRYGFRFVDPEPQWVADYVAYSAEGGNPGWRFVRPVLLALDTVSVDGRTPIRLRVELRHGPSLAREGGGALTPDVWMLVEGGEEGRERRTIHVLDAKFSGQDPLDHARETARRKYLSGLADRPVSAFVALPSPAAQTRALMGRLDGLFRSGGGGAGEMSSLATGPGRRYGFAWGAVDARPGPGGVLGLRQFLTLAFQYHRWELRHLCSQCGNLLTAADLDVWPAGATKYAQATDADRVLAAHRDEPLVAGGGVSMDELTYRCRRCRHSWRRHTCRNGHLLLKHGALTPHRRLDDADGNVVCSVCGHFKGGRRW